MRDAIGVVSAARTYVAERGAITRFAQAIGDPNPRYRDGTVAPPTFLRSYDQVPPVPEFEIPYPDILDGGSDWEFFEPVRAADKITVTTTVANVFEKTGNLGEMLFVVREHRYMNQNEQTAATQNSTTIYYTAAPLRQSPPVMELKQEAGESASGGKPPQPIYFENVSVGDEIPILEKHPTTRQLVQYAGASGDYYEIHYDQRLARAAGLPDVIVHGALKNAFLAQMLTDWIGTKGLLKKLSVQYRGMDVAGSPIRCNGLVTDIEHPHSEPPAQSKRAHDVGLTHCDVWTESGDGTKTTVGKAVVVLPSRNLG